MTIEFIVPQTSVHSTVSDLKMSLTDRVLISKSDLARRRASMRVVDDRWLLSSAVQKLIRRGNSEQAIQCALALHRVDPTYLPRRLPIIAFEDVGVGDLAACFDTLCVFGMARFPSRACEGERKLMLANLVERLARAVKSRTGCDLYCLAHGSGKGVASAVRVAQWSEQHLVDVASNRNAAVEERALSLHALSGMSVREGRWSRTISRFRGNALNEVAERLDLPELVAWLLIEGRNTSGLAAMLPLVLEAMFGKTPPRVMGIEREERKDAEKSIYGLPACAADMYTRVGKAAIGEFARRLRERYPGIFERIPNPRNRARLIEMALFHCEGSRLDRWLENEITASYRDEIERLELEACGWPDGEPRYRLYQLLGSEQALLWRIRRAHMGTAFGNRRRTVS